MKLPRVTKDGLKNIRSQMIKGEDKGSFDQEFDREVLNDMCTKMTDDNPDLVNFMLKSGKVLQLAQSLGVDTEWLFLMICITIYKALEEAQTYSNN